MEQTNSIFSFTRLQANKKLVSFLLCVLLAALIWFINALNKIQTTTVEVKIDYNQSWLKSWSSGVQPSKVTLEISGRGFDLANFFIKNSHPEIIINEEGLFNDKSELSTLELITPIFSKFGKEISIIRTSPSTIPLPSGKPFFKKVAIKPSFEISLNSAYMISGPAVCVPDSILLSSRERLPDTLKSINTLPFKKGNVSTKVFGSIGISLPPQFNIISELKSVWIYIPVERATEKEISVSLLPDFINGGNVELIPSIVKLTCRVPLSRYDQTTNDQFMVTASITSSNQKKAVVSVKNAPFWAEHVSIKPATVDYFYHN